eukprot:5253289-Pyramimonas_sp.AAC.1
MAPLDPVACGPRDAAGASVLQCWSEPLSAPRQRSASPPAPTAPPAQAEMAGRRRRAQGCRAP